MSIENICIGLLKQSVVSCLLTYFIIYCFSSKGALIDNKQVIILILTIRLYLNISKMMNSCPTFVSPSGNFIIIVLGSCCDGGCSPPVLLSLLLLLHDWLLGPFKFLSSLSFLKSFQFKTVLLHCV